MMTNNRTNDSGVLFPMLGIAVFILSAFLDYEIVKLIIAPGLSGVVNPGATEIFALWIIAEGLNLFTFVVAYAYTRDFASSACIWAAIYTVSRAIGLGTFSCVVAMDLSEVFGLFTYQWRYAAPGIESLLAWPSVHLDRTQADFLTWCFLMAGETIAFCIALIAIHLKKRKGVNSDDQKPHL